MVKEARAKSTASMMAMDGGGMGDFMMSVSFSIHGRCRDGDSKSATSSEKVAAMKGEVDS